MGCKCKEKCSPINGISYKVYIASADDSDGTGFTYPADQSQAYIGFASGLADNFTPTAINMDWVWQGNDLPLSYSDKSDSNVLTASFVAINDITVVEAGNYIAFYSGHCLMSAGVTGYVEYYIDNNGVLLSGSTRFWQPPTHAADQSLPLSLTTIPFAVVANTHVQLFAKVSSIEEDTNINFSTLILLRVS